MNIKCAQPFDVPPLIPVHSPPPIDAKAQIPPPPGIVSIFGHEAQCQRQGDAECSTRGSRHRSMHELSFADQGPELQMFRMQMPIHIRIPPLVPFITHFGCNRVSRLQREGVVVFGVKGVGVVCVSDIRAPCIPEDHHCPTVSFTGRVVGGGHGFALHRAAFLEAARGALRANGASPPS